MIGAENIEELAKKMAKQQGKYWDSLEDEEKESYRILARVADSYIEDWSEDNYEYFSCGC